MMFNPSCICVTVGVIVGVTRPCLRTIAQYNLYKCGAADEVRPNVLQYIVLQLRVRAVYLCEGFCKANRSVFEYLPIAFQI